MLPRPNKLTTSAEFRAVMKTGGRAGTRTLVVHAVTRTDVAVSGGPRFGLIVSKQVGNAVERHRVSRQLRHICMDTAPGIERNWDIVIRALPASRGAGSSELAADFSHGLRRAQKKAAAKTQGR